MTVLKPILDNPTLPLQFADKKSDIWGPERGQPARAGSAGSESTWVMISYGGEKSGLAVFGGGSQLVGRKFTIGFGGSGSQSLDELGDASGEALPGLSLTSMLRTGVVFKRALRKARSGPTPLRRARKAFELSDAEMGHILGVPAKRIQEWDRIGAPSSVAARLVAIAAIGDFLKKRVRRGVLPGLARTPAPAYGGQTLLEALAEGREAEVDAAVRSAFDWSRSA